MLPSDTVIHDSKKHSLTEKDWNDLLENFDNIENAIVSKNKKTKNSNQDILLKIKANDDLYGVAVAIGNNFNIITTAFKSTGKGINAWMNKAIAVVTAPHHQSGSSVAQDNNVSHSQSLNDIINKLKSKVNKNNNTYFQTTPLDLTNDFANIKSTDPNIVASTVEAYLNILINKEINTATNPLRIRVTNNHKAHIVNSNLPLTKGQKQRHNTALKNLVDIINNSILDNSRSGTVDLTHNSPKTTNRKARQVDSYRYFKTQIKINNDIYDVELTTEVLKNSKDKDVSDLYNVRVKKATPTLHLTNNSLRNFSGSQPNNNINNSKSQGIIQHQDAKGQITFLKTKLLLLYSMVKQTSPPYFTN